jgi:hypothetical protein
VEEEVEEVREDLITVRSYGVVVWVKLVNGIEVGCNWLGWGETD